MKHLILYLYIVIGALALSATALAAADAKAHDLTTNRVIRVGDPAPLFELPDLKGNPVKLSDFIDEKPTLVVFWSFFCFPCQAEMPYLQELYEELGPEKFSLVAVSLDNTSYEKFILPFVEKNKLTFPIVYDIENKLFFEVADKYGVVGTPTSFIIDADGRVRFMHLGRLKKNTMKDLLESVASKSYCADIIPPEAAKMSGDEEDEKQKQ